MEKILPTLNKYESFYRGGRHHHVPETHEKEVRNLSERDLYKLFSEYDGEVDLSDFTVEELTRLLGRENERDRSYKEKYFSYYDDVKSALTRA